MAISGSKRDGVAIPAQEIQAQKERALKNLSKSKVIDTRVVVDVDTAILKTKRYIDGSNWTVDYYNQLSTSSDLIGSVDQQLAATEQQYIEIKELNLKVTTPVDVANINDLTGSATILDFIPLIGDHFIATMVGDMPAIFEIKEVTERSYNLDRVYDIEFKLVATKTTNPNMFDTIKNRVTKVYKYDNDALFSESDPILLESDFDYKNKLIKTRNDMMKNHIREFTSLSSRNILISKYDNRTIHDQYVSKLFNMVSDRDYKTMFLDTDIETSIIDILLEERKDYLPRATHLNLSSTKTISNYGRRYRNAIGLNIDLIIDSTKDLPEFRFTNSHATLPDLTATDYTYLFSSKFYKEEDNLSLIEELLLDLLNNKIIANEKLNNLVSGFKEYNEFERYIYTPFIILIINYQLSKIYSVTGLRS